MYVLLHNEPNAENSAMLQALYSRSAGSVNDHLSKLVQSGSSSFMKNYYVGYGHASIGSSGYCTLFLEGISMLAAKAVENSPLFNGQETSSRYIDFSKQNFYNPYLITNPGLGAYVQQSLDKLRAFYIKAQEPLKTHLRGKYPNMSGSTDSVESDRLKAIYEKTISAKAFDILRGFLPAAATTNVAWTTSLRTAHEQTVLMLHHPLREVRVMASAIYVRLYRQYPSSFVKEYSVDYWQEEFNKNTNTIFNKELSFDEFMEKVKQFEGNDLFEYHSHLDHFYSVNQSRGITYKPFYYVVDHSFSESMMKIHGQQPESDDIRPMYWAGDAYPGRKKTEYLPLHSPARTRSSVTFGMALDFGSFRDLQRHRAGYTSMPVIDGALGFQAWYMDQLPESLKGEADKVLREVWKVARAIQAADPDDLNLQYVFPMGTYVKVNCDWSVAQAIYVAELRTGKTVHPTLRKPMQELARFLERNGHRVMADYDESDWTTKRGKQDIVEKIDYQKMVDNVVASIKQDPHPVVFPSALNPE
jgi:thymidylate synthase ThyX